MQEAALMRQCLKCKTVVENSQVYMCHIRPGVLRQCHVCALIFEIECEFERHKLVAHPRVLSTNNTAMAKPQPAPVAPEGREQGFRYLPMDDYTEVRPRENRTVDAPGPLPSELRSDPETSTDILEDPFDDRCALAQGSESGKSVEIAFLEPFQGDLLLDLSPPDEKAGSLSKAISQFQSVVRSRPTREEPEAEHQQSPTQDVELKKRVPISTTTTPTASPPSARVTPQASGPIKASPPSSAQAPPQPPKVKSPEQNTQMSGIMCYECGTNFSNVIALHQHQMMDKHNYCEWCYAFFADRTLLHKHKQQVHSFKCAVCGLSHFTVEDLIAHQQLKAHCYCKPCNSYFKDQKSHRQHMAAMHDNSRHAPSPPKPTATVAASGGKYKCTVPSCGFTSATAEQLRSHQQKENHNFCRPCNKAFCDAMALKNHKNGGGRHDENIKKHESG
ncbi:hypothetical protein CIRG_09273 [Coccidioides immitis RMSCC 2394]|uniref:C2H2-type domain-containing protein n=1 Tax=Coccidioides immitis RMSCC 2394 TaxID=404692 RepID=A0A0J6YQK6_COCIT|nr:hypothetical protein CIRG_09273 [Coccidioides immitis RMSCC 2394]